MKIHLAVSEARPNGANWTGTLCGRESSESDDGMNSDPKKSKVTCKRCIAIMADKTNWRNRRYLQRGSK